MIKMGVVSEDRPTKLLRIDRMTVLIISVDGCVGIHDEEIMTAVSGIFFTVVVVVVVVIVCVFVCVDNDRRSPTSIGKIINIVEKKQTAKANTILLVIIVTMARFPCGGWCFHIFSPILALSRVHRHRQR